MLLVALGLAEHVSNSSSVGRISGPHGIPVPALRLRQDLFRPVRTSQTSRTLLRTSQASGCTLQGPLLDILAILGHRRKGVVSARSWERMCGMQT